MKATIHLLLAEDDEDDCLFFKDALDDLTQSFSLQIVKNGIELMQWLSANKHHLPDVVFLDLNMPLKNGFDCLSEIKREKDFQQLPVIIFSTSADREVVNVLHGLGAHYYIRKPGDFSALKRIIHHSILRVISSDRLQPSKENFILQAV